MLDILMAILTGATLIVMGELCRWAWRIHDQIKISRSGWPPQ